MTARHTHISAILFLFDQFLNAQAISSRIKVTAQKQLILLLQQKRDLNDWTRPNSVFKSQPTDELSIATSEDPFRTPTSLVNDFITTFPPFETVVLLNYWLLALRSDDCSPSTIKNYRSDIRQFIEFHQEVSVSRLLQKPKLYTFLKQQASTQSKATLTRKLSCIAQFSYFAEQHGWTSGITPWLKQMNKHSSQVIDQITGDAQQTPKNSVLVKISQKFSISSRSGHFPGCWQLPIKQATNDRQVKTSTAIHFQDTRSQLQSKLLTLSQQFNRSGRKQLMPWVNLGFVLLLLLGIGFFGYRQFIEDSSPSLAYPTALTRPNRAFSFQGRLTDTAKNPIVSATNMQFKLFTVATGGSSVWDSGTCSIDPDQDGIFSTNLGSDCGLEIPANVFSENANIWLEVGVAGETLAPRQPIKTVAYALNSETLQGYPASASAVENTVLVMNNNGEVVLGNTSPVIKSTGDSFALEAQSMIIRTSTGSDGDIVLDPDGLGDLIILGNLDAQAAATVSGNFRVKGTSTLDNYLSAPGATLSATYAGGTALVLKAGPSATSDIMQWQNSGGTSLGIIDENGNVGIGTTSPSQKLHVDGSARITGALYDSSNSAGSSGNILTSTGTGTAWGSVSSVLDGTYFKQGGNSYGALATLGTNDSYGLAFETNNTERMRIDTGGNVGVGTTSPGAKLDISAGNLDLDNTTNANQFGVISKNGTPFIHNFNYGNNGTVTTNGNNTFVGINAGNLTMGSTATQTYRSSYNSAIGVSALSSNTTGYNNSAIGTYALYANTTGYFNSAIGTYALLSNTTGYSNSAIGAYALYANTTGYSNSAIGAYALYANTTGYSNSAIGAYALRSNTTGNYNSALGYQAGRYISGGLVANETSNNSLYLGYNSMALADGGTNEIVIGASATGVGSNSVVLGNDSITKTILKGNVGIGTTAPAQRLTVQPLTGDVGIRVQPADTATYKGIQISAPTSGTPYTLLEADGGAAQYRTRLMTSYTGAQDTNWYFQNSSAENEVFINLTRSATTTSTQNTVSISSIFNGSSTNTYTGLRLNPTINQTGSGITRGLYINPTLTATADWRAIDIASNAGFAMYQSGSSAKNYFAGNVGIGTTSPTQKLHVDGSARITGALYDSSNSAGSSGSILTSTGSGTAWGSVSSIMDGTYFKQGGNSYGALATLGTNDSYGLAFETNNTERVRIDTSGNVGIGTTSPGAKLEVVGRSRFDSGASFSAIDTGWSLSSGYSTGNWGVRIGANNNVGIVQAAENSTAFPLVLNPYGGNVGIGTTSPGGKLDINTTTTNTTGLIVKTTDDNTTKNLQEWQASSGVDLAHVSAAGSFYTRAGTGYEISNGRLWQIAGDSSLFKFVDGSAAQTRMVIDTSGNVGIGTTSPTTKLDIDGQIRIRGGSPASGRVLVGDASGVGTWTDPSSLPTSVRWDQILNPTASKTFAMSTNPTTFSWATGTGANNLFNLTSDNSANGTGSLLNVQTGASSTLSPLRIRAGSTEALFVHSGGNVGIGTTSPISTLDVRGTIYNTAGLYTYNTTSSTAVPLNVELTRTLSGTVGNTVELGSLTVGSGGHNVRISVTASLGGFSTTKQYTIPSAYNQTGGTWQIVNPISSTGSYTGAEDFLLEVNANADLTSFRLRKSQGTVGGTVQARIESTGHTADTWTASTATGTSSVTAIFSSTPFTQVAGNVGIGTTAPIDLLNVRSSAAETGISLTSSAANAGKIKLSWYDGGYSMPMLNIIGRSDSGLTERVSLRFQKGDTLADFMVLGATFEGHPSLNTKGNFAINIDKDNTGTGAFGIIQGGDGYGRIGVDGTTLFYVGNTGNVGIGTTSPSQKLDINGNIIVSSGTPTIYLADSNNYIQNNGSNIIAKTSSSYYFRDTNSYDRLSILSTGDTTINNASNSNIVTFKNSGNVGIGTTTPGDVLVVRTSANDSGVQLQGATTNVSPTYKLADTGGNIYARWGIAGSAGNLTSGSSANDLVIRAESKNIHFTANGGTTSHMTILSSGNVGIGTTSPSQKLHVDGSARITGALYDSSNSAGSSGNILTSTGSGTAWGSVSSVMDGTYFKQGGNSYGALATLGTNDSYGLALETNNTERMRIDTSGNVGIGTTAPSQELDVAGDIELANYLYFDNGTAEYLRWDSSNFLLSDDLLPNANDALDLGSDTARWKDLYLGGDTLHLGTSITDEGTISYNTTTNIFNFGTDSTTNGDIAFFTNNLYLDKSTGYVGIGTTAPGTKLEVAGGIAATGITGFISSPYRIAAPIGLMGAGTGDLTSVGTDATGTSPISVTVDPTGRFAYVANYSSNTVQTFTINQSTGDLTSVGTDATGTNPRGIAVDPTGRFAYVTNASSNTVQTYTINQSTGDLTSVGTDATGTYPLGVAVDPTGRFAYVTNASSNTVQTYTINQSTGDLTSVGTDTTGLFPYSVTVDPTGRFAYVANNDSSTIQTYTINQSTGDLTSVGTDTTGLFPYSVTVDPTGRFAYVPNSGSNTVQTYTINNFSGGSGYFAGSLGIGTTSPTAKIHAVGNQNGATRLRMDNTDSGTSAQVGLELNNNSGQALLGLYSSNYSAAPVLQNKLYFANTIGGMMFRATAGSDIRFGVGASVNDVDDLTIDSNGNIGIGTTAPARALHVKIGTDSPPVRFEDTNGYCEINPTTTTWTCTSDARLKKDVIGINTTNTLNKLMNLRPVSFKWNTQTNNDKRYGFIAQEVESIFPDLVTTDEKGIKTVAYGSLTPFIISGMQEQNVQISALTNSLANLATLNTPLTLDEFGKLNISSNTAGLYQVTNTATATPINNRLAAFTQTITAIIEAGLTRTKELVVSGRAQIADLSVGNLSINGQGLREYVESIVEENQPTIPVIVEIIPTPSQTPSDLAVNTISTESITTSSLNSTNLQVTDQTRLGSLIVQSDATVAGTLNADQVETATLSATSARIAALEAGIAQMETVRATTAIFSQATISGTLYAETIANLDQQIATAMQQPSLLDVLFNQTPDNNEDLTILKRLVDTAVTTASAAAQLDQSIADLNLSDDDVVITGQAAFINQYLKVNGTAYVADSLGVGNLLKVGNRLELTDSYLAFHADPSHENDLNIFSIQPSGKGILSLMAGLMTLDETGTVTIVGDLKVAGDVEVRGTLLSNLIESSDPNQPVRIKVAGATTDITNEQSPTTNPDGTPISHPSQPLGGSTLNNPNSTNLGSRFEIIGNLGQAVATVSGQGKISLTGGINIDSDSIARPDVQGTATNSAQLTQNSTKTTGRATLPAGNSELIIRNPNITADSLVYLTPLGSTNNQVLYVKQTTAAILSPSTPVNPYPTPTQSAYFVVGLDSPAQSDIAFTWWIVN